MLSLHPTHPQKSTPNLLPARIHHNGPINDTARYWHPTTDEKGTQHAYFRGRHLHGTTLPLPSGYTGAVVHVTEKTAPRTQARTHEQTQARDQALHDDDGDDAEHEDTEIEEVKIAEQIGTFDAVVVWDHGGRVDAERDMYIRGMREWIGFAESMHVEDDEDDGDDAEAGGKKAV